MQSTSNSSPISYTISDAVKASGMARSRLYVLIAERKIEARKAGRRTLILAESLRRHVENLPTLLKPE